jgi:hypothetical protein
MPGHIGTEIVKNSRRMLGNDPKEMSDTEIEKARTRMTRMGIPVEKATTEQVRQVMLFAAERFRDAAPMTAQDAAKVILQGVKEERWRILVGKDAHVLDRLVREFPEEAYEPSFMDKLRAEVEWGLGG